MYSYNRYGAVPDNSEGYWEDFTTLPQPQQDRSSTGFKNPVGLWEETETGFKTTFTFRKFPELNLIVRNLVNLRDLSDSLKW